MDDVKKTWRNAFISIVATAVLSIILTAFSSYVALQTMQETMKVIKKEQEIIRSKVDMLQITIERKVDRKTLDECLTRIDNKLEKNTELLIKINKGL